MDREAVVHVVDDHPSVVPILIKIFKVNCFQMMHVTCLDLTQTSPRQEYLSFIIKEGSTAMDMYHVVGTVLVTGRYLTKNTTEMHVDKMGLTAILLLIRVDKLLPTPLLSYASRALVVQICPSLV